MSNDEYKSSNAAAQDELRNVYDNLNHTKYTNYQLPYELWV